MAGESAAQGYERQRDRRQRWVAGKRPLIAGTVVVAFVVGWFMPYMLVGGANALIASLVDTVGAGDADVTSVHPPVALSWFLGSMLALSVAVPLLGPSRSEIAWRKGAAGERIVGGALDALAGDGVVVLHDRLIPGSRANIDHVAVSPAGVFPIDAKHYSGRLEIRRGGDELRIKGRDRSKLLDQSRRQARVVSDVLARAGITDVSVKPTLCFVGLEMSRWFPPRHASGVRLATPRRLRALLLPNQEMLLSADRVVEIGEVLEERLRPAVAPAPASAVSDRAQVSPPTCACGEQMVVRSRRSDGAHFYGCSDVPRCRRTQPIGGSGA